MMGLNHTSYPDIFKTVAGLLDQNSLANKQMEVAAGWYGRAFFLKLYKKAWASPGQDPLTAESRIFYSIWVDDASLQQRKIFYNIHALKLRKLKGYVIESRKFAELFRMNIQPHAHQWPNIETGFGPLTLMQGWVTADIKNAEDAILKLVYQFFEIEHIIDLTLDRFKR